ncbi:MAG: hypothetical protein ABL888_23105 [Pirellulaceae bacterium]
MNYEFKRFSPQSFERFAQSMACARLGAGCQIFGAGRDGAREATYEGECKPDDGSQKWSGYVVLQAKYLSAPKNAKSDLDWLIREIDIELKKFLDKRRNLRRPEYYIVVTNVTLTAAAANEKNKGGGTLDKFRDYMSTWFASLQLKDFYVWDANVLSRFLDNEDGIRRTFSAWTLPGDVLSAVLSKICPPEFRNVANRLVKEELRENRNIKTRDSGQSHNRSLFIDEVFVDLPLEPHSFLTNFSSQDADEDDDDGRSPNDAVTIGEKTAPATVEAADVYSDDVDFDIEVDVNTNWNVVNSLMVRAADVLSSSAVHETKRYPLPNRVVILGGPGQGKSTIGQFLAQLMRARFIEPVQSIAPDLHEIAVQVITRARQEQISVSGPLRFPIHIELPLYADFLSKVT